MRSIALKVPEELLEDSARFAQRLRVTRAEYIRMAIERMNRKTAARLRGERLAELSRRVREESMRVNAESAAIEHDPNAYPRRDLAGGSHPATWHGAWQNPPSAYRTIAGAFGCS